MKKEIVTLDNIKQDLAATLRYKWQCITWWRLGFVIPFSLLALFFCLVPRDFWTTPSDDLWMLPFVFDGVRICATVLSVAVAAYHLVRYILLYAAHRRKKRTLAQIASRADIDISVEQCGCVEAEWIYEPRIFYSNRWRGNRKKCTFAILPRAKNGAFRTLYGITNGARSATSPIAASQTPSRARANASSAPCKPRPTSPTSTPRRSLRLTTG